MLLFLFRVGLACYVILTLRSIAVMIYLKDEGYNRAKERSTAKLIVDNIESFIKMQIPIYNISIAIIALFVSDEKIGQQIIDRGDFVKMERSED